MCFGEKCRWLRKGKGPSYTQARVGKEIGMSQKKISRLERNTFEPSLKDIFLLCEYYRVSADFLLGLPEGLSYPAETDFTAEE